MKLSEYETEIERLNHYLGLCSKLEEIADESDSSNIIGIKGVLEDNLEYYKGSLKRKKQVVERKKESEEYWEEFLQYTAKKHNVSIDEVREKFKRHFNVNPKLRKTAYIFKLFQYKISSYFYLPFSREKSKKLSSLAKTCELLINQANEEIVQKKVLKEMRRESLKMKQELERDEARYYEEYVSRGYSNEEAEFITTNPLEYLLQTLDDLREKYVECQKKYKFINLLLLSLL